MGNIIAQFIATREYSITIYKDTNKDKALNEIGKKISLLRVFIKEKRDIKL